MSMTANRQADAGARPWRQASRCPSGIGARKVFRCIARRSSERDVPRQAGVPSNGLRRHVNEAAQQS